MKEKLCVVTIVLFIVIVLFSTNVYASYSISNIFSDAQDFADSGNAVGTMIDTSALKNTSSFLYKLFYAIGMIVAVAIGIVLGIQFMVASAEDKAKVKEALVAYVIGCIVLFGAYRIWNRVTKIVKETTKVSMSVSEMISIV